MQPVLDFLISWWGLVLLAVIIILKLIFDYEATLKRARELIFLAEELARKEVLKTGQQKFEWVKENGYTYLPASVKLFISKDLYGLIVQAIFDKLTQWAESKSLTA